MQPALTTEYLKVLFDSIETCFDVPYHKKEIKVSFICPYVIARTKDIIAYGAIKSDWAKTRRAISQYFGISYFDAIELHDKYKYEVDSQVHKF